MKDKSKAHNSYSDFKLRLKQPRSHLLESNQRNFFENFSFQKISVSISKCIGYTKETVRLKNTQKALNDLESVIKNILFDAQVEFNKCVEKTLNINNTISIDNSYSVKKVTFSTSPINTSSCEVNRLNLNHINRRKPLNEHANAFSSAKKPFKSPCKVSSVSYCRTPTDSSTAFEKNFVLFDKLGNLQEKIINFTSSAKNLIDLQIESSNKNNEIKACNEQIDRLASQKSKFCLAYTQSLTKTRKLQEKVKKLKNKIKDAIDIKTKHLQIQLENENLTSKYSELSQTNELLISENHELIKKIKILSEKDSQSQNLLNYLNTSFKNKIKVSILQFDSIIFKTKNLIISKINSSISSLDKKKNSLKNIKSNFLHKKGFISNRNNNKKREYLQSQSDFNAIKSHKESDQSTRKETKEIDCIKQTEVDFSEELKELKESCNETKDKAGQIDRLEIESSELRKQNQELLDRIKVLESQFNQPKTSGIDSIPQNHLRDCNPHTSIQIDTLKAIEKNVFSLKLDLDKIKESIPYFKNLASAYKLQIGLIITEISKKNQEIYEKHLKKEEGLTIEYELALQKYKLNQTKDQLETYKISEKYNNELLDTIKSSLGCYYTGDLRQSIKNLIENKHRAANSIASSDLIYSGDDEIEFIITSNSSRSEKVQISDSEDYKTQ